MSKIIEVFNKINEDLQLNRSLEQQVFTDLSRMVSSAIQHSMMQTDQGYCFKFNVPVVAVNKLYKTLNLDEKEVFNSFKNDWGSNTMKNYMHSDSFYQILLLLIYYGLKNKKDPITENALFIFMMKIWNGRKAKYIQYCDPKIMNYVVSNMMSKKHIASRYDHPLFAIKDYFVPTLLKKYGPYILKDPSGKHGLKHLLEQAYTRVAQMFVQNPVTNLKTGKKENTGGLLPLYMKAKEEGSFLKTTVSNNEDQEQVQLLSINERENIASIVSNFITLNPNPQYSQAFINSIYRFTNVRISIINNIAENIHNHQFHDYIYNLIILIISRLNINQEDDICKTDIYSEVKRKIISSKNNDEIIKIRKITNSLINEIFKISGSNIKIEDYSGPSQVNLRNVVLYLIVSDMKKVICQKQLIGQSMIIKKFQPKVNL